MITPSFVARVTRGKIEYKNRIYFILDRSNKGNKSLDDKFGGIENEYLHEFFS